MSDTEGELNPIEFGTRVLELLDTTKTTSSYKFATLLALIDEVVETVVPGSGVGFEVSGRAVAHRVIELYWPQAQPFGVAKGGTPTALSQDSFAKPKRGAVTKLADFRSSNGLTSRETIRDAKLHAPKEWAKLERDLIGRVIRMPLAKLQRFGVGAGIVEDRFLYDFSWPDEVAFGAIEADGFDDSLRLRPGVAEALVQLAPLLRPAIQMKWADYVAKQQQNRKRVDQRQVDEYLFGVDRIDLSPVRGPLLDLQDGKCFYCDKGVRDAHVDHFVPWARHPSNLLTNLVVAHSKCNIQKSATLAGLDHLDNWLARSDPDQPSGADLSAIASDLGWHDDVSRSISIARGRYSWLPSTSRLWVSGTNLETIDAERCKSIFDRVVTS